MIGDYGRIGSAGGGVGATVRRGIQVSPSLYEPPSEITVPAPPPPSGSSGDGWQLYVANADPSFDNAPTIAAALMSGNVKLRLVSTSGNNTINCGSSLMVTTATAPWLDLNGNVLKWTRAADQASTAEWDPTGGEGSSPASLREHVAFTKCTNVLLMNGTIEGFNATAGQFNSTLEKEAGIMLRNCSIATVSSLLVQNVWGDGIALRAVSAHLPQVNEYIAINTLTVKTVGRMQAALTNFFYLTINGFFTSPSSTYSNGGTLFPNSGRSPRSALDIEMVNAASDATAGGTNALLAESAYATITNFFLSANFFALANGGGGYVHDIHMFSGTVSNLGINILSILGRDDDLFARRKNFYIHHITWPEMGGGNNAMGFQFVRNTLSVHDMTVTESNVGAGKNGIGMKECEGVEIYNNNFIGGFATTYSDDVSDDGSTGYTYPPSGTNSGTSSWVDGDWGTAVGTSFSTPQDIDDDDNDRAKAILAGTLKSFDLQATNFGLTFPTGVSTFDTISVRLAGFAETTSTLRVQLVRGGTLVGTYQTGTFGSATNDVALSFDTAGLLWGTSWTTADLTSTGFGVWMGFLGGGTVQLDSVRVRVTYEYAIGPSTIVRYENNVPAAP